MRLEPKDFVERLITLEGACSDLQNVYNEHFTSPNETYYNCCNDCPASDICDIEEWKTSEQTLNYLVENKEILVV